MRGDADDIVLCVFDGEPVCTPTLFWDGDSTEFGGERIDGLGPGALFTPDSALSGAEVNTAVINDYSGASEVFDDSLDEDELDGAEVENAPTEGQQFFYYLPVVDE
ncbi:MAG: hypothetical protein R2911_37615 [Caldilineaceae bacterium]